MHRKNNILLYLSFFCTGFVPIIASEDLRKKIVAMQNKEYEIEEQMYKEKKEKADLQTIKEEVFQLALQIFTHLEQEQKNNDTEETRTAIKEKIEILMNILPHDVMEEKNEEISHTCNTIKKIWQNIQREYRFNGRSAIYNPLGDKEDSLEYWQDTLNMIKSWISENNSKILETKENYIKPEIKSSEKYHQEQEQEPDRGIFIKLWLNFNKHKKNIGLGGSIGLLAGLAIVSARNHFYKHKKLTQLSSTKKAYIISGLTLTGGLVGLYTPNFQRFMKRNQKDSEQK